MPASKKDIEKKKVLLAERDEAMMWTIRYEGGGQLPKCLAGQFTERKRAMQAIDNYKASL